MRQQGGQAGRQAGRGVRRASPGRAEECCADVQPNASHKGSGLPDNQVKQPVTQGKAFASPGQVNGCCKSLSPPRNRGRLQSWPVGWGTLVPSRRYPVGAGRKGNVKGAAQRKQIARCSVYNQTGAVLLPQVDTPTDTHLGCLQLCPERNLPPVLEGVLLGNGVLDGWAPCILGGILAATKLTQVDVAVLGLVSGAVLCNAHKTGLSLSCLLWVAQGCTHSHNTSLGVRSAAAVAFMPD
jgi:hypothetical protein